MISDSWDMCGLFQRETEKAVDHCGKIRYIIVSYSAVRQTDAPLLLTFPEERTVMEQNLTNGSVMKHILRFSLPYLLAYFLQTLYGMADLFIIGQFEGVAGTTAVAVGSQVMHLITVMLVGLAMGSTVLMKRFKDDVKEVNSGYECGMSFEKYNDIKEGDQIEAFVMEEVPR